MSTSPDAPVNTLPAGERMAVVRSAIAPIHGEPRVSSPQISQRLAWHPVELLERRGDWYHVRGLDRYEGWMHAGYLAPASFIGSTTIAEWPLVARRSLGCVVRGPGGELRGLPVGAFVHPDERIEFGRAVPPAELRDEFPAGDASSMVRFGSVYFEGAPYVWGGVSPWGCDCSGFVQSVFEVHGVKLPRDAWQQAEAGASISGGLDSVVAGDLLFFSDRPDGRITHVGLGLGDLRMAHVAVGRGGFSLETLDGSTDEYADGLLERFRFARRYVGLSASAGAA